MSQCDNDVKDDEYINTLEHLQQKQAELIERLYTVIGERENEIEWCRRELTKMFKMLRPGRLVPNWRQAYIGNRLVESIESTVNKHSGKTGIG